MQDLAQYVASTVDAVFLYGAPPDGHDRSDPFGACLRLRRGSVRRAGPNHERGATAPDRRILTETVLAGQGQRCLRAHAARGQAEGGWPDRTRADLGKPLAQNPSGLSTWDIHVRDRRAELLALILKAPAAKSSGSSITFMIVAHFGNALRLRLRSRLWGSSRDVLHCRPRLRSAPPGEKDRGRGNRAGPGHADVVTSRSRRNAQDIIGWISKGSR